MAKIIRIENTYELGEILAQIAKSDEQEVVLQVTSDSKFLENTRDVQVVRGFAEERGKSVNVQSTEKYEKLGFVAGADVTSNPPPVKPTAEIKKPKVKMPKAPKFSMPKIGTKGPLAVGGVLLIVGLLSIGGYVYAKYNVPTAQITLTVTPEIFTGSKDVVAKVEPSEGEIKMSSVQTEVTGEITAVPTGEKEVGDAATGEIEITNKSDDEVKIESGTEVTINFNGSDLVFVTDEDAEIDGSSEEEVTDSEGNTVKADVYKSKKVGITASSPGESYNISNDDIESDDISINSDDEDDLEIELSSSTSGGTAEKATVVSEKDLTDLRDKLLEKLQKEANEDLQTKISNEEQLLEGATEFSESAVTYSAEVDEEVGEITGTMTVNATGYYIATEDIKSSLEGEVDNLVPENYQVSDSSENIAYSASVKEVTNNPTTGAVESAKVTVKIQAYVIPNVNTDQIANDLSGISVKEAEEKISTIDNIEGADINQKPSRVFSGSLPKKPGSITVEVKAAQVEIQE
jgi:hypothetical protein